MKLEEFRKLLLYQTFEIQMIALVNVLENFKSSIGYDKKIYIVRNGLVDINLVHN